MSDGGDWTGIERNHHESRCDVLAIFARAPVLGNVKTRLAQNVGDERALQSYRAMLRDVLHSAQQAARMRLVPFEIVVLHTPQDAFTRSDYSLRAFWDGACHAQSGGDLSARLADCFAVLRARGFEKIVVIGSDAPDLPPQFIAQALALLETCDTVFGPAHDGGFYLIGASCELPAPFFNNVRWSDAQTLNDVLCNAKQRALTTNFLPQWRDVDDESDLRALELRLKHGESAALETHRVLDVWGKEQAKRETR